MRTDELIHLQATDAAPVRAHAIERRFGGAAVAGVAGAGALMMALYGLRPDLAQTLAEPMFWVKLGFAVSLAVAGVAVLRRLARPGLHAAGTARWLALPPALLLALALWALAGVPASERLPMVLGSTWRTCPFNIALLSLPALAGSLWALRGAAPTHLAWAGAGAGLLAGALGASVYALHCPEMAAPFLVVWYLAGMAIPTVLGAVLGPRLLRW